MSRYTRTERESRLGIVRFLPLRKQTKCRSASTSRDNRPLSGPPRIRSTPCQIILIVDKSTLIRLTPLSSEPINSCGGLAEEMDESCAK